MNTDKLKEIIDGLDNFPNSDEKLLPILEQAYQLGETNGKQAGRGEVIGWGNLPIDELEKLWQSAIDVKNYAQASFILYLINTKQDYSKIQEIMQRDKLGMGGESIVGVLIKSYNQLKEQK